tara:strand:- start:1646 stop:1888 length:243 start_codon:yes stop_codon:yes gene_type:complete
MKWYEARTLEEFNALPFKERKKMPNYLECRKLAARLFALSVYDPFNEKRLAHLDQREHEAINVSANSPYKSVKKDTTRRE